MGAVKWKGTVKTFGSVRYSDFSHHRVLKLTVSRAISRVKTVHFAFSVALTESLDPVLSPRLNKAVSSLIVTRKTFTIYYITTSKSVEFCNILYSQNAKMFINLYVACNKFIL